MPETPFGLPVLCGGVIASACALQIRILPYSVVNHPTMLLFSKTSWRLALTALTHRVASAGPLEAKWDEKWGARWTEATRRFSGF